MRKVTIPVDDHETECNEGYIVEYKLTGEVDYTRQYPDPITEPIVITNLLDDSEYDIRITRKCCNGSESDPTEIVVDTTI